jgi:hypothetical protein
MALGAFLYQQRGVTLLDAGRGAPRWRPLPKRVGTTSAAPLDFRHAVFGWLFLALSFRHADGARRAD